jgi:hypothetical protein
MPDLNETVLPVVWTLVRRVVARESLSRDELVQRLTPARLISRAKEPASRHVRPSIRALEDVGILGPGADGRLSIDEAYLDDNAFRCEVARRVLDIPEGGDVWALRGDSTQLEHHAEVATAWLCLQGLETEVAGFSRADELLSAQIGGDRKFLRDTAPFNTLERWTQWFGIAISTQPTTGTTSALIPDTTALITWALDDLIPPGSAVSMSQFMVATAQMFPWMPHGRIGREVAERMREIPDSRAAKGACPQCLAFAMHRLELTGDLELHTGDDPKERVSLTLPGGQSKPVARVARS